jgi:ketosteroid isomerase-like protein
MDMADHPNAALARQAMDSMNTGDFQAMAAFLDDDVVWHEIGRAEPRRGKAELMEAVGPTSYYDITAEVHDVVANDDHIVALVNATATRDGKTFEYRTAEIMHVRDGKVVERWAFSDDTDAINKFFA